MFKYLNESYENGLNRTNIPILTVLVDNQSFHVFQNSFIKTIWLHELKITLGSSIILAV